MSPLLHHTFVKAGAAWRRFLLTPPWLRRLVGFLLWFYLDDMRNGFKWPARLAIFSCLTTGFFQLLYRMDGRPLREWALLVLRSPLTALVGFVAISLQAKEFFPLSHFAMYSDPEPQAEYLHLAEQTPAGDFKPLASYTLLRLSTSKVGKIFRSRLAAYVAIGAKSKKNLTSEDERIVGVEALEFFQERAEANGSGPMPGATWVLLRTVILPDPESGIREETIVIAARKAPANQ